MPDRDGLIKHRELAVPRRGRRIDETWSSAWTDIKCTSHETKLSGEMLQATARLEDADS